MAIPGHASPAGRGWHANSYYLESGISMTSMSPLPLIVLNFGASELKQDKKLFLCFFM